MPGEGSSSQEPPPPPQPRLRSIDNMVNEFGAWATYQNLYQTITSAYLSSMDSLMRGMSRQMGLDTTTYPPPSAFLPPFQFQYSYLSTADPEAGVPPPPFQFQYSYPLITNPEVGVPPPYLKEDEDL